MSLRAAARAAAERISEQQSPRKPTAKEAKAKAKAKAKAAAGGAAAASTATASGATTATVPKSKAGKGKSKAVKKARESGLLVEAKQGETDPQLWALRNTMEMMVVTQFLKLTDEFYAIERFSAKELELSYMDHEGVLLLDIHSKLLRSLMDRPDIIFANWESIVREQYQERGYGDEHPLAGHSYTALEPCERVKVTSDLCQWCCDGDDKLQSFIRTLPANDMRVLPIGRDSKGNSYFDFDDLRLYALSTTNPPEWRTVCISSADWQTFEARCKLTKSIYEKRLFAYFDGEVPTYIQKLQQLEKKEQLARRWDAMPRKRSSRIQNLGVQEEVKRKEEFKRREEARVLRIQQEKAEKKRREEEQRRLEEETRKQNEAARIQEQQLARQWRADKEKRSRVQRERELRLHQRKKQLEAEEADRVKAAQEKERRRRHNRRVLGYDPEEGEPETNASGRTKRRRVDKEAAKASSTPTTDAEPQPEPKRVVFTSTMANEAAEAVAAGRALSMRDYLHLVATADQEKKADSYRQALAAIESARASAVHDLTDPTPMALAQLDKAEGGKGKGEPQQEEEETKMEERGDAVPEELALLSRPQETGAAAAPESNGAKAAPTTAGPPMECDPDRISAAAPTGNDTAPHPHSTDKAALATVPAPKLGACAANTNGSTPLSPHNALC